MFESIKNFFFVTLYQPLFNLLILLYNWIPGHDFGLAIIALTILIRIILFPLSIRAVKSQAALQKIQPKIQEIQKKYKDDKEKQAREVLELYKKEKINPFSALMMGMVQIPILIALYHVFWKGLDPNELTILYSFVSSPGQINSLFLNIIDLSKPNLILALIAGLVQYFQTKMLQPPKQKGAPVNDFAKIMQTQMTYFLPFFTIIILISLPSALGLYWTTSGLFSIIQQYFILRATKEKSQSQNKTQT